MQCNDSYTLYDIFTIVRFLPLRYEGTLTVEQCKRQQEFQKSVMYYIKWIVQQPCTHMIEQVG